MNDRTEHCELVSRNSILAFAFGNFLVIRAEGEKPAPCYPVRIARNLLTVEPPEFVLQYCRTGALCPEVITPYDVTKSFRGRSWPDEIVVHHAGGSDTVKVQRIDVTGPLGKSALVSEFVDGDEAIGRSPNLSFDEAFADAVQNLGPIANPHPDQLDVVVVTEIRGEFGGIAGFHDLVVTIRRQ